MQNKQNPEEIQEAMKEQLAEQLSEVPYAPDVGNERLVEDAFA